MNLIARESAREHAMVDFPVTPFPPVIATFNGFIFITFGAYQKTLRSSLPFLPRAAAGDAISWSFLWLKSFKFSSTDPWVDLKIFIFRLFKSSKAFGPIAADIMTSIPSFASS